MTEKVGISQASSPQCFPGKGKTVVAKILETDSDQPEDHFALFADHVLIPGRIPDDIDLRLIDAGGDTQTRVIEQYGRENIRDVLVIDPQDAPDDIWAMESWVEEAMFG